LIDRKGIQSVGALPPQRFSSGTGGGRKLKGNPLTQDHLVYSLLNGGKYAIIKSIKDLFLSCAMRIMVIGYVLLFFPVIAA